jgi:serine/threonine protein kinase
MSSADRNLLFGILALQMDFISRDALIAAMHAWVLDKVKPLGQVLLEQDALTAKARDKLEAVVELHLEMHGGDPQKSLAALSAIGSVRRELQKVADVELHDSLAQVSATRPDEDPWATQPPAVGEPSVPGLRFRILHKHAEGGLGAVFVAEDEELHRRVALKEIKEKYADHLQSRSRFLLEAEVTGGLEHPGIVPVYGLGHYPDGRPFYAMRFIKGDSLRDAIRRFHAADGAKRDPGERSLAFRELLGRFVDACNALAYAHARGILHRDVKPYNIMLGKFGETLVVDWGLAKVIGRHEGLAGSDEGTLRPTSGDGTTPTQAGDVIGTPAYMSPEQAGGQLDRLGPASDIYSLGATLYELLTSAVPVNGHHAIEILGKVRRGDWLAPRKIRKDVPPALDAICRKAMALQAQHRYPTALALAADVEHWLGDEPVTAYREPWSVRTGRWLRRHRPLVAGAAALLLAGVPLVLVTNNLANIYYDLPQILDPKLREETLAQLKAKLDPDHPLAFSYVTLRGHAEALKLRQERLALRKAKLGPDHPDTLVSMWGVAESLVNLGRGAEAVPLIDDCVQRATGKFVDPRLVPGVMDLRLRHFEKMKDPAGCRQTAALWEKLNRADAASLYTAACMRAVTAATAGAKEADVEAEKAMAWLKQAVAAGFKDAAHMDQDKDLDALRDREDFKNLLAELAASAAKQK